MEIVNFSPLKIPKYIIESCPILSGCICDGGNDKIKLQLSELWTKISDVAYCLCLKDCSKERYDSCTKTFHEVGLCKMMRFYRPDRPCKADISLIKKLKSRALIGSFGSGTSHQMCAKLAHDSGANRVLIIEDDIELIIKDKKSLIDHLKNISNQLNVTLANKNYDVYYLGHLPICMWPVKGFSMYRTMSICIHSYILTRQGMATVCNIPIMLCDHHKEVAEDRLKHRNCTANLRTRGLDVSMLTKCKQYCYKHYIFDQLLDEPTTFKGRNRIVNYISYMIKRCFRLSISNENTQQVANIIHVCSFVIIVLVGIGLLSGFFAKYN